MPRWQTIEALGIWSQLREEYRFAGYLLASYGSALLPSGGRDLDLLAIPWRPNAAAPILMEIVLANVARAVPVGAPEAGLMKSWSRVYELPGGWLLDIQYRRSEIDQEVAMLPPPNAALNKAHAQ